MTIDIIDLSDPQYEDLNPVQLSMVRAAQARKDEIVAKADASLDKLFYRLLKNDNARSSVYERESSRIRAEMDAAVEAVREDLRYQLSYEALGSEGNELGPYRYPENPNYNLSYSQRFLVVREYYMRTVSEPNARFQACSMDTLAQSYLGEFYPTLLDLLASYI